MEHPVLSKISVIIVLATLSITGLVFLGIRYTSSDVSLDTPIATVDSETVVFPQGTSTVAQAADHVVIPADPLSTSGGFVYAPRLLVSEGTYFKKKFYGFTYDSDGPQIFDVAGSCTDAYYAILVFSATDNYADRPTSAKYNQAERCPPSKRFEKTVNLSGLNLPDGKYYFFVADQGTTRSWYNPR